MGVVAAYLFLYPTQRIRTLPLFGIIPIPYLIPMPAWVFILYTVAHDIVGGMLEQELQAYGYTTLVGWFAHLGGVIAGLTCLYLFLPAEIIHYRRQIGEEV
jgi:membrane associated rhomboid family serine protease